MLIPHTLKRSQMFTKLASMQSLPTTVSKWQIHAQLSKNIHKCSQSCIVRIAWVQMLNPLYSCLQHSQMFTKFASMQSLPTTLSKWQELSQMFTKLNCTYCLPSTLILHVFCLERSSIQLCECLYLKTFTNIHKVCLYAKFAHNSLQMANPCTVV